MACLAMSLGCARLTMGPNDVDEPGGINVYADRIEGYEWGCVGRGLALSEGRGFGVQGLCGGEGIPSLEQYIIELGYDDPTQMTVYAADGDRAGNSTFAKARLSQGGKG
jgi:hypothetical protein